MRAAHAFVAPVENGWLLSPIWVFHHVFQIADYRRSLQIGTSSRNQRLVHVQRDAESAAGAAEIDSWMAKVLRASESMASEMWSSDTADIRQTVNDLGLDAFCCFNHEFANALLAPGARGTYIS